MRSESEVKHRIRLLDQELRSAVSTMYKERIDSVHGIASLSLQASILYAATKELDWVLGDDEGSHEGVFGNVLKKVRTGENGDKRFVSVAAPLGWARTASAIIVPRSRRKKS